MRERASRWVLVGGFAALVAVAGALLLTRPVAPHAPKLAAPAPTALTPIVAVVPPDRAALEPPAVVLPSVPPVSPREAPTHPRALVARLDDVPEVSLLGVPLAGPDHAAPRLADLQPKLAAALRSTGGCAPSDAGSDGEWTWPESGVVLHQGWAHDCDPDGAVTGITIQPPTGAPWIVETSHGAAVLSRTSHQLPDDFQLWSSFASDAPGPRYVMHAHARCGSRAGAMASASAFTLTIAVAKGRVPSADIDLTCADPLAS